MAKSIAMYKLGVVLDVQGAKGLSTLKAADSELTKVDKSGKRAEGTLGKVAGALGRVSSALKGNAGGAGDGGWLPGLAHVSNIIQGLPQIGQLAGALVSPLTDAAQSGVRFNAFLETTEIALKRHFGGSRDLTGRFINEVRQFAQSSPFRTEGLIKSIIYGTATGFNPRDALALVKDVGDAIASTGDISEETVQGVVRALSQMKAKGTVSAEEMEQLAERGIPAWEMLAHSIGKTVAQTRKLSEQGKLHGPSAVAALRAEMRARYGGMMEELEDSFVGRRSALEDKLQEAEATGSKTLFESISKTYGLALRNSALATDLAKSVDSMIKPVAGLIEAGARTLIGGNLTAGLKAGIDATSGLVFNAVSAVGLGTIQTLMSVLKINSPSLVMKGIGESVGEGFQIGGVESLDEAQEAIVNKIIEIGRKVGATADEIKAALATGWVESRFRNLRHGHLDSLGVMQQRPSQGWGTAEQILDPDYAARKFYAEAMRRRGRGLSPGALAQSVQRSAYPDRYDQALPFINSLVRNLGEGSGIEPVRVRKAWEVLAEFARMSGFTVTSTTGGKHNPGSLHGRGLAVDVRTRDKSPAEIASFMESARAAGISVRDERTRPAGQAVWGGPHLHLSLPNGIVTRENPLPVIAVNGGSFNPATAPQVIARAQRESAEVLPIFNRNVKDLTALMPQWGDAVVDFGRIMPRVTLATEQQALAAGHAAQTVLGLAKSAESTGQRLVGMLAGLGGLMPQQQVGKKRGFLSKLLGVAAPFLSFIPGVGPLLSTFASMGSSALAGDWGGVLTGAAAGFAPGGAFRGRGSGAQSAASQGTSVVNSIQTFGVLPGIGRRERGGPVSRGRAYVVGESQAEVVEFGDDGYVHPSIDSYLARRGGGGGGGRGGGGGWGAMVERLMKVLEDNSAAVSQLRSMPPGEVVTKAARTHPHAFTDGFMRHGAQDPRVVDWMQRRIANQ